MKLRSGCTSQPLRCAGEGLISLMVGLGVSILAIGAMLSAYRATVAVSLPATRSATRDGQIASALMAAQIELQQAGFGVLASEGANLLVTAAGDSIVWRYRRNQGDATFECAGLSIERSDPPDAGSDGLYWLPPVTCTNPASVDPSGWGATPRLVASTAAFYAPSEEERMYELSNARFRIEQPAVCGPFGQAAVNRALVVLEDSGRNPPEAIFEQCLTNP